MKRLAGLFVVGIVAIGLLLAGPAVPASAIDTQGGLSETGQLAVRDLRTCLASEDVLNVYYLIDNSRSLDAADGMARGTGSDPDYLRASILANSLDQLGALSDELGSLGEAIDMNWAAGFFSTDFDASVDWSSYTEGAGNRLEQEIRERTPDGYTDWPEALNGAKAELEAQQARAPGCQLLVWLTDGQIDIGPPDGQGDEDFLALNAMCGGELDDRGVTPAGSGIFNAFRQSEVVVLGALLAATDAAAQAEGDMRPLIEGHHTDSGQVCGQHPVPDSYANGAFLEATTPDALAQVFLQLAAQVAGGYPNQIGPDGEFWVDPGVARFRLIIPGDWTLEPPATSGLPAATNADRQPWLTDAGDESVVEVDTTGTSRHGMWRVDAPQIDVVNYFSDLAITFEPTNAIDVGRDGEAEATLFAQVEQLDGSSVRLTDYSHELSVSLLLPEGTPRPLDATLDESGRIEMPIPADVTATEVQVEADLELSTRAHKLLLMPVTARDQVETVLPDDFPTIADGEVPLSTLEGSEGTALGDLVVAPPASGGAGQVCLPADPAVQSDTVDRIDSWEWSIDGLDADDCADLAAGEEPLAISIRAQNDVAADSTVRASVPVELRSADGEAITQEVPITFVTTHPVNVAAVGVINLVLLALGILLPLVALWVVNWATTKLELGRSLQRATFPVRISQSGVEVTGVPSTDRELTSRFTYVSGTGSTRSLADGALGRLHADVHWFPLNAPRYAVSPSSGNVVISARSNSRAAGAGERNKGSIRFKQLPLDEFTAVVVPRNALARAKDGESLEATAVIYHRPSATGPAEYRARIAAVERDTDLPAAVRRAQADIATREKPQRSGRNAPTPSASARTTPPKTGSGAPPRAGGPQTGTGSGAPPRSDSAPAGGPPPRPGGPAGGPPPRPGSRPSGGSGSPPPRGGGR